MGHTGHRHARPDATTKAGICREPKSKPSDQRGPKRLFSLPQILFLLVPALCYFCDGLSHTLSEIQGQEMRVKCIEIHWHDGKPIATCDFQPVPFKKARPTAGGERSFTRQTYKLATGGEDNHVRVRIISLGRQCKCEAESSLTRLWVSSGMFTPTSCHHLL